MPSNKTFTGALALIKVAGLTVGRIRGITGRESVQRARIQGIGTIFPKELNAISWAGDFTVDHYLIRWDIARIPGSIKRDVQTDEQFEDWLVHQENGLQIDMFKKISDVIDANGIPVVNPLPFGVIKGAFMVDDSFNVSEGQVGGHAQAFQYIHPIIYPV